MKFKLILKGEVKRLYEKYRGIYNLQPELVNSYPCWTNRTKTNSIWFDIETREWKVGSMSDISSRKSHIIGPTGEEDWLHNLSSRWKYVQ